MIDRFKEIEKVINERYETCRTCSYNEGIKCSNSVSECEKITYDRILEIVKNGKNEVCKFSDTLEDNGRCKAYNDKVHALERNLDKLEGAQEELKEAQQQIATLKGLVKVGGTTQMGFVEKVEELEEKLKDSEKEKETIRRDYYMLERLTEDVMAILGLHNYNLYYDQNEIIDKIKEIRDQRNNFKMIKEAITGEE